MLRPFHLLVALLEFLFPSIRPARGIEGKTFLVTVESEKIIGCGGYLNTQTFSELRAFFVHPEISRKGIASKIMSKCIEYSLK